MARKRFCRLLQANFPERACLVTLAYEADCYTPTEHLAYLDIQRWIRLVRKGLAQPFRYIRLTEPAQWEQSRPVHRIVTDWMGVDMERISTLWEYGPVSVDEMRPRQFAQLAEMLVPEDPVCGQAVGPCKRAWSLSGELWAGKTKAGYGEAQKNHYGGVSCENNPVYGS